MTELEKIKRAKIYIEQLANGTDPITGDKLPNDTVLNNERLSRCFSYVAEILQQVVENGGVGYIVRKKFEITEQQKRLIPLSDAPLLISAVCDNISSVINLAVYRRLSHNKVTEFLVEKGFLRETISQNNKRTNKTLTEKSSLIGIRQEERTSQYNGTPYTAILYSKEAQQFIIDHLGEILAKSSDSGE